MQRLSWAIIVAAGLLALAWNGEILRGYIVTAVSLSTLLGLLPFWTWLFTLAVVLMAFIRLWTVREPSSQQHFEVVASEQAVGLALPASGERK